MWEVIGLSYAIQFTYGLTAMGIGWFGLQYLDHRLVEGKGKFDVLFQQMAGNPIALGAYLGLRFVGLCIFAAALAHK